MIAQYESKKIAVTTKKIIKNIQHEIYSFNTIHRTKSKLTK